MKTLKSLQKLAKKNTASIDKLQTTLAALALSNADISQQIEELVASQPPLTRAANKSRASQ